MNGNGKIGLDDAGIQIGPRTQKARPTPVVEAHGSGLEIVSRPRATRTTYEGRIHKRRVAVLILCVAALVTMSALAASAVGVWKTAGPWLPGHTYDVPVASFNAWVSPSTTVIVNASASTGTGLTYAWNFGDSWISTGVNRSHFYIRTADFTVTLTVTDDIGQTSTATRVVSIVNPIVPPPPFTIAGATFASDGTTPLPGCTLTFMDVNKGEGMMGQVSDVDGLYSFAVDPRYITDGDVIIVSAVGPGSETGSNSGVINTALPFVLINVTLTPTGIPEFGSLVMPIAGILAIFSIAGVASRRARKE